MKKRFYYFKKGNYNITRIKNYNFSRKQIINIITGLYNNAINLYNKNYEALCFRGLISDNQKDLDKAIEVINHILDDNDNYESTYNIFSKLNLIKNKIEDSKYKDIIDKLIKEDFSMKINYKIKIIVYIIIFFITIINYRLIFNSNLYYLNN